VTIDEAKGILDIFNDVLLFPTIGLVIGAVWSFWVFSRNNRIKAAEILLQLEKDYSTHLETLLKMESSQEYDSLYKGAIQKQIENPLKELSKEERKNMDDLEAALRYFYVCAYIRELGVDSGYVDRLNAWYLRLLTDKKHPELREYVKRYWPSVYYWAPLAAKPWPKQLFIYTAQVPERLKIWWIG